MPFKKTSKSKFWLIFTAVLLIAALLAGTTYFVFFKAQPSRSGKKVTVSSAETVNSKSNKKTEKSSKNVSKKNSAKNNSSSKPKNSSPSGTAQTAAKPQTVSSNIQTSETPALEKITASYNIENPIQVKEKLTAKKFFDTQSGKNLPYRIFVPENYSSKNKYPILLMLHGAGERGNDNSTQLANFKNAFQTAGDFLSQSIVIFPQCPANGWWNIEEYSENYTSENGWLGVVVRLLKKVQTTYSCDSNRIYVTGLSMGGMATWDLLTHYPEIFAAGVPVCGSGDTSLAYRLTKIPIWAYHGTADTTVSFYGSESMYNAVLNAGGSMIELKALDGVGHNAWSYAYGDREMFCWLFAQTKTKAAANNCDYSYRHLLKVTAPGGETLFTEENINYLTLEYYYNNYRIVAELDNTAQKAVKQAYTTYKNKNFTVYYYGQKLYTFQPLTALEDADFPFAECATETLSTLIAIFQ